MARGRRRSAPLAWAFAVLLPPSGCVGDDGTMDGDDGTAGNPGTTAGSSSGTGSTVTTAATGESATTTTTDGTSTTGATSSGGEGTATATSTGGGGVWVPPPGTNWQWQLTGTIDTSLDVEMYDIDLFDAPQAVIDALHADGRIVVCYFSAGSYEDWRPDAGDFPMQALGKPLDGWPGERWLDVRDPMVRAVQAARLDLAAAKNCDGVEPDNVDGYQNDTGFPLTARDQLDYNTWLATEAHARGLSVGLKNDLDQVEALEPLFDWALDEECVAYDECDRLAPFVAAGKAVFHVEYVDDPAEGQAKADAVCPVTAPLSFSTLIKQWDLDAWRIACP